MKNLLFSLLSFTLIHSSLSLAAVNWRTGNYHAQFIEEQVTLPNGELWKWERVYDSASDHQGWWGLGWGSNLETRLDFGTDGAIYLVSNGTGPISVFESSPEKLAEAKKEILENPKLTKDQKDYQLRMISESPQGRWESFAKNKSQPLKSDASQWEGLAVGLGALKKVGSSIQWSREGKILAEFNQEGKLQKIWRGPYSLDLEWKGDRPQRLSGNKKIYMDFQWSATGARLEKVNTGKKQTLYSYNTNYQLEKSTGTSYPNQTYQWSSTLLTSLSQGEFSETITYDPKSNRVMKIVQGDKVKTYSWKETATETTLSINESPGSSQSITYRYRPGNSGEKILVSQEHKAGSQHRLVEFLPCCSLPTKIVEGSNIHTFNYDDSNRLLEINFPDGSFHKYTWPEAGKVPTSIIRPEGSAQITVTNGKAMQLAFNQEKILAHYNGEQLIRLERQGKNPLSIQLEYKDGQLWRARVGDMAGIEFTGPGKEMKIQGPQVSRGKLEFYAIYMKFLEWTRSFDPTILLVQ